ncbi:hypothetical protein MATL_G00116380 [Megalops atlanticus]|uniref:Serpin domain-containing protein n=1 Tax=Megalops atlanticus TaxID=7932 RepID=A0A9D3PXS6_MEGAT|nr:hypothetical protein MATL_G00116380 [Megalops atlanticus]
MDIHLLALLLFCLCSPGHTDNVLPEDTSVSPDKIHAGPLIPLIPSLPKEEPDTTVPPTTQTPPFVVPTHDSPDYFFRPTVPVCTTSPPQDDSSSTEEYGEGCGPEASSTKAKRAVGDAVMKLGLQLLETLRTSPEQPNVIVSPLSVSLALSQLALGAVNETEDLLLRSLHADTLPCYHKSLRSLLRHLRKSALQVATRMYLKPGFEVKSTFEHDSLRMYGSKPAPLAGVDEVNQWVENATKGRLTNFLSSLPPSVILMLINAVHFKGSWLSRFDPRFTSKDLFFIDDKHVVHVDMMLGPKYPLSLLIDSELEAQVARFPFKQHMSLLVVVPQSGHVNVSDIAAKFNTADLYARFPRERIMRVKLPKFKLEYSQELQESLTKLGLGEIFSGPNLAGIANGPLFVSSVQHKSSMEVNEEGAEAAAATAVIISRSNPTFTVNQPFFFALMDDTTQTPVFLGVITNPNPDAAAMDSFGSKGSPHHDKLGFSEKHAVRSHSHTPK